MAGVCGAITKCQALFLHIMCRNMLSSHSHPLRSVLYDPQSVETQRSQVTGPRLHSWSRECHTLGTGPFGYSAELPLMGLVEGERPVSWEPPGGWGQPIPRKNRRDDLPPAWHMTGQDQDTSKSLRLSFRVCPAFQHFDASPASQPRGSQLFWPLAVPDN